MKNFKIDQTVYEKYVDATVEFFMECYSGTLSSAIQEELKDDENQDIVFPKELDKRCQTLIKKECAKQRMKQTAKNVIKGLRYAAIFAVVMLSFTSLLFMTVEAVRIPIINYYIEESNGQWAITGQSNNTQEENVNPINMEDPLDSLISEEYELIDLVKNERNLLAIYQDVDKNLIVFSADPIDGYHSIDSEDAQVSTRCVIGGRDAILVVKGTTINIVWFDESNTTIYGLYADKMIDSEALQIVEQLVEKIEK